MSTVQDYKPTSRRIGDEVFSTGFHDSISNDWIPVGTKGKVALLSPTRVDFEGRGFPPVAVMRSDVRPTVRAARSVASLPRTNLRWCE